jgi:hypothetical protein
MLRRDFLKGLASIPFVGALVPKTQAAPQGVRPKEPEPVPVPLSLPEARREINEFCANFYSDDDMPLQFMLLRAGHVLPILPLTVSPGFTTRWMAMPGKEITFEHSEPEFKLKRPSQLRAGERVEFSYVFNGDAHCVRYRRSESTGKLLRSHLAYPLRAEEPID